MLNGFFSFVDRTEHIDQDLMKQKGIKVGYTPDVLTADVADMSVTLTLMTMRRVKEHVAYANFLFKVKYLGQHLKHLGQLRATRGRRRTRAHFGWWGPV